MIDVDEARKRWLKERQSFSEFGVLVAGRMENAVRELGIWCQTSSRAKEPHSLIKKLLKGNYSYDSLQDKAGARCVVRHMCEIERVCLQAQELFDCLRRDDKLTGLGTNRIGYNSIHLMVRLREGDPETASYPAASYIAELQIRTFAQHLWAEMSHDSFYKNEGVLTVLPVQLVRRAHLMAGLIEVADHEFDRLNREITSSPEAQMYKALERHYYTFTTKRPDPSLSLEVIKLLLPLYNLTVPQIATELDKFLYVHRDALKHVYKEAEEFTTSAFLYQPEVLMIYERLEANQLAVRKAWISRFPESELEGIANALGISFD
ncbi:MAG TPA: hypothetical protein VGX94_01280 [Terriglobia bacterium]|nr:hypothetical protein [Terriglobia bacterium]